MRLTLSAEDHRGVHMSEMQIVKQALRAYVIDCEETAAFHTQHEASAAALYYLHCSWVVRRIIEREFGEEVPQPPERKTFSDVKRIQ